MLHLIIFWQFPRRKAEVIADVHDCALPRATCPDVFVVDDKSSVDHKSSRFVRGVSTSSKVQTAAIPDLPGVNHRDPDLEAHENKNKEFELAIVLELPSRMPRCCLKISNHTKHLLPTVSTNYFDANSNSPPTCRHYYKLSSTNESYNNNSYGAYNNDGFHFDSPETATSIFWSSSNYEAEILENWTFLDASQAKSPVQLLTLTFDLNAESVGLPAELATQGSDCLIPINTARTKIQRQADPSRASIEGLLGPSSRSKEWYFDDWATIWYGMQGVESLDDVL